MSYYKECPKCGETTHSACGGGTWKCQICWNDLSEQPLMAGSRNDKVDIVKEHLNRVEHELNKTTKLNDIHYFQGQKDILEEVLGVLEVQE